MQRRRGHVIVGVGVAVVVLGALGAAGARAAHAEACVEPEVARVQGGRPCGGLATSMGQLEVWRAPGFLDVRIGTLRIGLFEHVGTGTSFELASWEAIGDGDEVEAVRDQGPRSATQLLTLRRQRDRESWGAYVASDVVTRWFGHTRAVTPRLGLRLGRFDRAAVVVEATLAGAYLLGGAGDRRSLTGDVDVTGRATLAVARRLRLEARGRYRDLGAADGRHLRDVAAAIGVELEASPRSAVRSPGAPDTWRVMTLFAGVAVRRALVDIDPDAATPAAAIARAASATTSTSTSTTSAAAPWQVMAWLDLDFAINSQRTLW